MKHKYAINLGVVISLCLCINFTVAQTVSWCNLQFPASTTISYGNAYPIYGQVYEPGLTDTPASQGAGITAWIGFSETDATTTADFTSSDWTWVQANYNPVCGANCGTPENNDEYFIDIGPYLPGSGTFYYATRFQYNGGPYTYGGYNAAGGGFWDGATNVSQVLTVNANCLSASTWDGTGWDNGVPDINTAVTFTGDYTTTNGNILACSITVNAGATLTIENDQYVEVNNDVIIDGSLNIQPRGSLLQHNNNAVVSGTASVTKKTAPMNDWYEYTYWSSPVANETVGTALSESDVDRRFIFDASAYSDGDGDSIDDDGNDWVWVSGTTPMTPGVGYAATHDQAYFTGPPPGTPPFQFDYIFTGTPNNGLIEVPVERNDAVTSDFNWNFIGNPYPSAIDVDLFFDENIYNATTNPTGNLEGAIYLWSQNSAPSAANDGNEQLNFSMSDYAIINRTGANDSGGDGNTPSRYIPSGQGFFIAYSDDAPAPSGNAVFNNSMRVTGNNDQFFRTSSADQPNKIKVNLTANNGVFNQILVGYVEGATDAYDGMIYDAPRNLSSNQAAILYTTIENIPHKFAIQGKTPESLGADEVIYLGFKNTLANDTPFTLSLAQLEGDFMTNTPIYLVDNLLGAEQDLTQSDYTFTSEMGEFNNRFELRFSSTLSVEDVQITNNQLIIVNDQNDNWNISTTQQSKIAQIIVYDLLGRKLIHANTDNQTLATLNTKTLNQSVYIVKVKLYNGFEITKKTIKH